MDRVLIEEALSNIENLEIIDVMSDFEFSFEDREEGKLYLSFQEREEEFVIGNFIDFRNCDIILINNENLVTVIFERTLMNASIIEEILVLLRNALSPSEIYGIDPSLQTDFRTYLQFQRNGENE